MTTAEIYLFLLFIGFIVLVVTVSYQYGRRDGLREGYKKGRRDAGREAGDDAR